MLILVHSGDNTKETYVNIDLADVNQVIVQTRHPGQNEVHLKDGTIYKVLASDAAKLARAMRRADEDNAKN